MRSTEISAEVGSICSEQEQSGDDPVYSRRGYPFMAAGAEVAVDAGVSPAFLIQFLRKAANWSLLVQGLVI